MSKKIIDMVLEKKQWMTDNPSEAGRNSALAIAAIKEALSHRNGART